MPEEFIPPELELGLALTIYLIISITGALFCAYKLVVQIYRRKKPKLHFKVPSWVLSWSDMVLMAWVVIVLTLIVQGLLLQLAPNAIESDSLLPVILSTLLLQAGLAATYFYFRHTRPDIHASATHRLDFSRDITGGLFYFLALLPLIWLVSALWQALLSFVSKTLIPIETSPQEAVQLFFQDNSTIEVVLLGITATVIAPIVEELFFRGGLYRFLKSRFTTAKAIILSGLVFALLHSSLSSFLPLWLFGCLLCLVYEETGKLSVAIFMHAFFNLNTILVITLMPN